jgi:polyhydroxyalkanoate synthesis repressor PhaR
MTRVIKKYANRRLYDTETSRYIKLTDLKQLLSEGVAVRIVDAKAGTDLTREVLLQLVAEQESLGQPILSERVLTALIRFYDHPLQKIASNYLETALEQLQLQQTRMLEQMRSMAASPVDLARSLTRQNLEWLGRLQQDFLDAVSPRPKDPDRDRKDRS